MPASRVSRPSDTSAATSDDLLRSSFNYASRDLLVCAAVRTSRNASSKCLRPWITSLARSIECRTISRACCNGRLEKPEDSVAFPASLLLPRPRLSTSGVTAQVSRPTQLIKKHRVVIRDQSETEANLPALAQSATRFVSTYGVQVNNFNALSPRTLPGQLRHPDMPTTPCVENGRF